jgi:biopolymer transport protein ExbD
MAATVQGAGIRSAINVTPLVDVVLVLLIIFMVLSPSVLRETDVNVPEQADVQPTTPPPSDQLVMAVDAAGNLRFGNQPLALPAVTATVSAALRAQSEKVVFFEIDDAANYGHVLGVMDLCRGAGARTIGVVKPQ